MRLSFSAAALALALCATPALGQTPVGDREAVRLAALDYVEALYNVQPERIEKSVHPTLVKRGFYKDTAAGPLVESPMTYDQLFRLAGNWNKEKKRDLSIKEVAVLDVLDQTAVAKVTANWGIDYMLLAKFEEITQILWQSHPPKPAETTGGMSWLRPVTPAVFSSFRRPGASAWPGAAGSPTSRRLPRAAPWTPAATERTPPATPRRPAARSPPI